MTALKFGVGRSRSHGLRVVLFDSKSTQLDDSAKMTKIAELPNLTGTECVPQGSNSALRSS